MGGSKRQPLSLEMVCRSLDIPNAEGKQLAVLKYSVLWKEIIVLVPPGGEKNYCLGPLRQSESHINVFTVT